MAVSPSIPTSFVPKQPVTPGRRPSTSGTNFLLLGGIAVFVIALLLAGGVFLYQNYLTGVEKAKSAQLQQVEQGINNDTVQQFVQLRDRLNAAQTILNQHVALTQFLSLLETITVRNVRYDNLSVDVADDRTAKIQIKGEATDFNALAAEATAFASQKDVKSAIFSDIGVEKGGVVTFSIDAQLDANLTTETTAPTNTGLVAPQPAGTSTVPLRSPTVTTAPSASAAKLVAPSDAAQGDTTQAATTTATTL